MFVREAERRQVFDHFALVRRGASALPLDTTICGPFRGCYDPDVGGELRTLRKSTASYDSIYSSL